ncbi:adenosylhomocysteinase [Pseudozyma hubeiensis SY62]|uniref:Adenosylhomocysteinase n=1 Tax=Pseudozyma hubeiensis (strain SY62) TaxID=1305764 RepID=R9P1V8_PSEHS|nr:adenosylhomocysteinase [Pseudozyma hubeiensis SY62]GAC95298.1 adenosylhomocysteinase [Pseudozyma hubeiensis SY62]
MTDTAQPSDASSAQSAAAHTGTQLITNHILTIPHPQYTHFLTQIVHLRTASGQSSFFVHCSHLTPTLARSLLSASTPNPEADSLTAEDAELEAALAAAGRTSTSSTSMHSTSLATDFALAINPTHHTSTSIEILTSTTSASTSSLATSISKRLSAKLSLPHLLLSLSLPPTLTPAPGSISSQQDSHALLLLEKALRDTLQLTLHSSSSSQT